MQTEKPLFWTRALIALGVVMLATLTAACGSDDDTNTNSSDSTSGTTSGDAADTSGSTSGDTSGTLSPSAYYDGPESAKLGSANNQARCSTCHSDDGTLSGFSGKTFKDIAYHTNFKGGMAPDLLAATNECVVGWMGGTALTAADAEWTALEAYMQSISDEAATTPNPLVPEVLADEAAYETAYAGGDATAGEAAYATFCTKCHASGLVVNLIPSYDLVTLSAFTIGRIAQKVRTSGPPPSGTADATDTTPGPMPFF